MISAGTSAVFALDSQSLTANPFEVTPRNKLRRKGAAAKALGSVGLGAAFVLGSGEAFAGPKTMLHDGESYFNVGGQNTRQLDSGSMELTFENGQSIVVPVGQYGYHEGDLYISEKHLPYELAHAVMTPQQVDGYIFSKTATAEGLSPIPTTTVAPAGSTVYGITQQPAYMNQFIAVGALVLVGAGLWWILTQIGDAPEFEYPIYSTGFAENSTDVVYTALAKDHDSSSITYSLRDDADAYDNEFFAIDSETGDLTFITAPNFEAPADDNRDNVYDVKIDATDNDGGVGSTLLHVTVQNVTPDPNETTLSSLAADDLAAYGGSGSPEDILITDGSRDNDVATGGGMDYVLLDTTAGLNGSTVDLGSENDLYVQRTTATTNGSIFVGAGDDRLVFEANMDDASVMTYNLGTGADTIVFTTTGFDATTTPVFQLYTADDTIDLSALNLTTIDSNSTYTVGNIPAALAGADIAYYIDAGDTILHIDTNNDGTGEIIIEFEGLTSLDTDSIIL